MSNMESEAYYTIARPKNNGKDSLSGHYELMGVENKRFYKNFNGTNIMEPLYLVREDKNAIRRRTAKRRWYAYQTELIGYRLLNYPKRWLIRLTVMTFVKSITPFFIVDKYRKFQSKKKGN